MPQGATRSSFIHYLEREAFPTAINRPVHALGLCYLDNSGDKKGQIYSLSIVERNMEHKSLPFYSFSLHFTLDANIFAYLDIQQSFGIHAK